MSRFRPLWFLLALLWILVSGCQTIGTTVKLETVEPEPAVIQKKVHVGDDVVIGTKDGKEFSLRLTQVTDAGVAGLVLAADTVVDFDAGEGAEAVADKSASGVGEEIEIPFDQIETIEIEKIVKVKRADTDKIDTAIDVIDTAIDVGFGIYTVLVILWFFSLGTCCL